MPYMEMDHEGVDPKKVIYDQIGMKEPGKLPGFKLFGNRVLVGIYTRPVKTKSNILLPDQTRDEDKMQGKSALVLMKGRTAFVSDDHYDFGDDSVEPGDWISLWVSDGRKLIIKGLECRIIRDQDINMVIPAPDVVY